MKVVHAFAVGSLLLAAGCSDDPCDPTAVGEICTIAGNGENGYSGEGGPALEARMSLPMDMASAPDGSLYVLDWNNHRIRRLSDDGLIHFVAGDGELGGSLPNTDTFRYSTEEASVELAGVDIERPQTNNLNHPTNLLFDATGSQLYVAAWHNSKIRILDLPSGELVEACGDGRRAYFGDDKPALRATLDLPASIAWSPTGDLVIMDQANQVIRNIDANGVIHRLAGTCVIDAPAPLGPGPCAPGVAPTPCPAPSGKSVCGDPAIWCSKACSPAYNGDDIPASEMRIAQQFGQSADPGGRMVYDPQGNLYFADVENHLIRMIDTNGIVRRIAGQPKQAGYSGDGGPALAAELKHPVDLALADDGTLFFTDVFNHCVRAIAPDGTIRTVAGQCGKKGHAGDGGSATKALLSRPYGIEWVAPNLLYIADTGNSVIRVVPLP